MIINSINKQKSTVNSNNNDKNLPIRRMNVIRIQTGQPQILDNRILRKLGSQKNINHEDDDLISEDLNSSSDEIKMKRQVTNNSNKVNRQLKNPLLAALI